jgi:hypothetical protein
MLPLKISAYFAYVAVIKLLGEVWGRPKRLTKRLFSAIFNRNRRFSRRIQDEHNH